MYSSFLEDFTSELVESSQKFDFDEDLVTRLNRFVNDFRMSMFQRLKNTYIQRLKQMSSMRR